MLQIVSYLAMEAPSSTYPEAVRDEQAKVPTLNIIVNFHLLLTMHGVAVNRGQPCGSVANRPTRTATDIRMRRTVRRPLGDRRREARVGSELWAAGIGQLSSRTGSM